MLNSTKSPAFTQLLDAVSDRYGVASADVAADYSDDITFRSSFGPLNEWSLSTVVDGHLVKVGTKNGINLECRTCTQAEETRRGLPPGSLTRPVICPAAVAAGLAYVVSRNPGKFAQPTSEITPIIPATLSESRRAELETDLETLRGELPHTLEGVSRVACKRQIELIECELSEDDEAAAGNSWGDAPLSPAHQVALDLKSEYPELAGRVDRALELAEAGVIEFPQYNTAWDNAGFYGNYTCDCPDAQHRAPRAKFGCGCKHALAMEIARRVEAERMAVAQRKLADTIERSRARIAATQAGYDAALRPDPLNRTGRHVYQLGSHRVK